MNIKIYSVSLPVCVLGVKEVLMRKLNTLRLDLGEVLSFVTDNTYFNIDTDSASKHIVLCSSSTDVSCIKMLNLFLSYLTRMRNCMIV